jgi:hypothetical protein
MLTGRHQNCPVGLANYRGRTAPPPVPPYASPGGGHSHPTAVLSTRLCGRSGTMGG